MRSIRPTVEALLYAVGHFLVDLCCALTMLSLEADAWLFVLYNFLAFAVQMPIGLLADFFGCNRNFAIVGIFLVLFGFLPCPAAIRVIAIGLGNACYHVGGGREALLRKDGMTGLGIFVSPGAIGILLGTLFAQYSLVHMISAVFLTVCGFLILRFCNQECKILDHGKPNLSLAALMMAVVLLRSLVGMCLETPWKLGIYVIAGGLASAAGKALGGIVADRFGWKVTGFCSLVLAALLFLMPQSGIAGVLGVLLFNMTMPITLSRASDSCPGYEGFAFGLLTFGLFLGYVPSVFGISISPLLGTGLSLLSAGLLMISPEVKHG